MVRAITSRSTAALFALALLAMVSGAPTFAADEQAAKKPATKQSTTASRMPPHLACVQVLTAVRDLHLAAAEAIKRNDLEGLTKVHQDIETRLRTAREEMDQAFLTGAWQSPAHRQTAAEILGQLEGVQMLNFIGLAFLKGYENPVQKVSPSVIDASDKMFLLLGQLLTALDAFNAAVARSATQEEH